MLAPHPRAGVLHRHLLCVPVDAMNERDMVRQFHEAMGLPLRERPTMSSEAERLLRCRLLLEETLEYIRASGFNLSAGTEVVWVNGHSCQWSFARTSEGPDLAAMAHENADVRVITHGNDLTMGSPPEVHAEVMCANMSKLGDDGKPVLRGDGKVMKGPNYRPPDVAGVLERAAHACTNCLGVDPASCVYGTVKP